MTAQDFERAAAEYLAFLKKKHPEHFMESVAQATQRKITVASLDLVAAVRSDLHVYSELLIQWRDAKKKMRRVVPDNMVVVAPDRPVAETNFAIGVETARPFFVLEYVSKTDSRKDYQKSYDKYEAELKVPYYLIFHPEDQELSLYRYNELQSRYRAVHPNGAGRHALPELDLEMGLLDGWVRYWWKGTLLPITLELQAELVQVRKEVVALRREITDKDRQLADKDRHIAEMQAELERLRKSAG
jgi:Uma2 family endonuclease